MTARRWIARSVVAGASGSVVHFLFMYPHIVPWALSLLNGMTILGFLFARINRLLPGKTGAVKG
jgi:hypothetical protein